MRQLARAVGPRASRTPIAEVNAASRRRRPEHMDPILDRAHGPIGRKSSAQGYGRRERRAVKQVGELLDGSRPHDGRASRPRRWRKELDSIERIDRLTTDRRNPPRRQPARDRAASGGARRSPANGACRRWRTAGFEVIEPMPAKRKKRGVTSVRKINANRAECPRQHRAEDRTGPRPLGAKFATPRAKFCRSIPIQYCPKRLRRSHAKLPGPVPTRKSDNSRAESQRRRLICAACDMHVINC